MHVSKYILHALGNKANLHGNTCNSIGRNPELEIYLYLVLFFPTGIKNTVKRTKKEKAEEEEKKEKKRKKEKRNKN